MNDLWNLHFVSHQKWGYITHRESISQPYSSPYLAVQKAPGASLPDGDQGREEQGVTPKIKSQGSFHTGVFMGSRALPLMLIPSDWNREREDERMEYFSSGIDPPAPLHSQPMGSEERLFYGPHRSLTVHRTALTTLPRSVSHSLSLPFAFYASRPDIAARSNLMSP